MLVFVDLRPDPALLERFLVHHQPIKRADGLAAEGMHVQDRLELPQMCLEVLIGILDGRQLLFELQPRQRIDFIRVALVVAFLHQRAPLPGRQAFGRLMLG